MFLFSMTPLHYQNEQACLDRESTDFAYVVTDTYKPQLGNAVESGKVEIYENQTKLLKRD